MDAGLVSPASAPKLSNSGSLFVSVGIGRSWFNDANQMVVEGCLAIGQFDFGHVAADAIIFLNWTRFGVTLTARAGRTLKGMARQTLYVICRSVYD